MELKDLSAGSDSVHGAARKGAKQFLEDSFLTFQSPNGRVVVGAVFDGHGGFNGVVAANTARELAAEFLEREGTACESWSVDEWSSRLTALFNVMHNEIRDRFVKEKPSSEGAGSRFVDSLGIVRAVSGEPIHGGSTASFTAVIRGDDSLHIVCANVGDSMVLVTPSDASKYQFLAVDHGPENPDEFKRIQSLSHETHPTKLLFVYDKANVFRKYECPRVFRDDGKRDPAFVENPWGHGLHPTNVRYEPGVYAVTPRNVSRDTTCIAMTRALGDFYAQQFGLTHIPSITVRKMPLDAELFILVASDGIWDCWKYEDFAAFVNSVAQQGVTLSGLAERTLEETMQRAVANFGSKSYDDAALVVIPSPVTLSKLRKG